MLISAKDASKMADMNKQFTESNDGTVVQQTELSLSELVDLAEEMIKLVGAMGQRQVGVPVANSVYDDFKREMYARGYCCFEYKNVREGWGMVILDFSKRDTIMPIEWRNNHTKHVENSPRVYVFR